MKKYILYFILLVVVVYGCKKSYDPPAPAISGFSPSNLSAYNVVTIYGQHFDSLPSKNIVKFNGADATVLSGTGDSVLVVIAPANIVPGKITVASYNNIATSKDYGLLKGSWTKKASLPPDGNFTNARGWGIGFAIGNTGYMGLGTNNGQDFDDLYAYDASTNSWSKKSSLPIGIETPACMVINNKAYTGIAYSRQLGGRTRRFFEYDPVNDSWKEKAVFPGSDKANAIGIGVGDKGYFGIDPYLNTKDWWQYDPATDSWTRKADFPGGDHMPYSFAGFALNGKIFLGGPSYNPDNTITAQWWQYDPITDVWTRKADIPRQGFYIANGVVINNKGYLMGGSQENWLYDDVTDSWTQKAFFQPRTGGFAFALGNKGYFGTGLGQPSIYLNDDFWEYTPD